MTEERNIFNFDELDKAQIIDEENKEKRKDNQLTRCVYCGEYPIIEKTGRVDGYKLIYCPICKYTVGTLYEPIEHWNMCNRLLFRKSDRRLQDEERRKLEERRNER